MTSTFIIDGKDTFDDSLNKFRDLNDSLNWVIIGHKKVKYSELQFVAYGEDGIEGMKAQLKEDEIQYCIFKYEQGTKRDKRYVHIFIRWAGAKVKSPKNARWSLQRGPIEDLFRPFHLSLDARSLDEITADTIEEKLEHVYGRKVHIPKKEELTKKTESEEVVAPKTNENNATETVADEAIEKPSSIILKLNSSTVNEPSHSKKFSMPKKSEKPSAPLISGNLIEIQSKISNFSSLECPLDWMLFTYSDFVTQNSIIFVSEGNGDLSTLIGNFKEDNIYYGILGFNIVDQEKFTTRKLISITYLGPKTSQKGKIHAMNHENVINELLNKCSSFISSADIADITQEKIDKAIALMSTKY